MHVHELTAITPTGFVDPMDSNSYAATVGFDLGADNLYYTLPFSGTDAVVNLTMTSNTNNPGLWIYRVDQSDLECRSSPISPSPSPSPNTSPIPIPQTLYSYP